MIKQLAKGVTLYLGDCREILPTLGYLASVVTDPPYGISYQSNHRSEKYEELANDGSKRALRFACGLYVDHSKYVFCRWEDLRDLPAPKSAITWVKNNWSMGDLEHEHARQTEMILFYAGPKHYFPRERPTDVIEAVRTVNDLHPTEKPIGLLGRLIGFTKGTVVDPFMGSGSTGVAAVKQGRQFVGIEINPSYFAVACDRVSDALRQQDLFIEYNAIDDIHKSVAVGFEAIRERKANGGPGWEP